MGDLEKLSDREITNLGSIVETLTNYSNIKYPYVPVMADAFVKKAQELIDLGF